MAIEPTVISRLSLYAGSECHHNPPSLLPAVKMHLVRKIRSVQGIGDRHWSRVYTTTTTRLLLDDAYVRGGNLSAGMVAMVDGEALLQTGNRVQNKISNAYKVLLGYVRRRKHRYIHKYNT
jgi:hypothetical protein